MAHWSDIYPHKIWTNIMVLDDKVIDYKIGGDKRDLFSWSIWWNDELISRQDEIKVISTFEIVNNDIEHKKAFEKGRQKVEDYIKEHAYYHSFMKS